MVNEDSSCPVHHLPMTFLLRIFHFLVKPQLLTRS